MKTKGKQIQSKQAPSKSAPFGLAETRGQDYGPLRLRDDQGVRKTVLLFDTQSSWAEEKGWLVREDHPELRADLTKALGVFKLTERRFLFNVLVRKQSVTTAVKRMKRKPAHWWRTWLRESALPQLREALKEYNGKRGVEL